MDIVRERQRDSDRKKQRHRETERPNNAESRHRKSRISKSVSSEPLFHVFPDSSGSLHTVVAVDRDLGPNSEVSYEIIRNPEDAYSIDSKNGQITLVKIPKIDNNLVVRALDNGSPQLLTDQSIEVKFVLTVIPG